MNQHERKSRRHAQQPHDDVTTEQIAEDQETPIDYLSRNNHTTLIKDAVKVLLANRPDDPLQFLVDFFAPKTQTTIIEKAYDKLCWTDYSMPVYQRNVLEVYDQLTAMKNEDTHLKGLLGIRFNELLEKLANDLPEVFAEGVYLRVKTRQDQVISFRRFYHSILLMHVLKDFVSLIKAMHKDLDVQDFGKVSQKLCSLVVERLFESFNSESTTLGNDRLFASTFLENAESTLMNEKESLSEQDFVKLCIDKFLDYVE
ncbi:uncharacterized protein [Clytia hemisphaerica]|uniref:Uncharacterized protein n=1 Tax=Clytia hemisphaerica TaxID=252671 RepID=A0A7M5X4T1_9CNID